MCRDFSLFYSVGFRWVEKWKGAIHNQLNGPPLESSCVGQVFFSPTLIKFYQNILFSQQEIRMVRLRQRLQRTTGGLRLLLKF